MLVWESITEYAKRTGMSVSSIRTMIRLGEIQAVKTDGGGKWMIKLDQENSELHADIAEIKKMLTDLSKHFGVIK